MVSLIVLALVLSVIALVVWLFTAAAVGYVLWRYAYTPWMVMRKDVTALNQKTDDLKEWTKSEMGLRAARTLSDEEEARMEAILRRQTIRGRLS